MIQTPIPPAAAPPVEDVAPLGPASPKARQWTLAPDWLQVVLIFGLLGAAVFVALDERYLWATLLAVAGGAFGVSFVLRRMVGDEYGRT